MLGARQEHASGVHATRSRKLQLRGRTIVTCVVALVLPAAAGWAAALALLVCATQPASCAGLAGVKGRGLQEHSTKTRPHSSASPNCLAKA
jgi:hypothetical protein